VPQIAHSLNGILSVVGSQWIVAQILIEAALF
jgi:hypothetical protein